MDPQVTAGIADWLDKSACTVVFTGAGISTESGIPDFRSPGGIWTKYRTVYYDEFMASADARHEYWRQKSEGHRDFADAEPNAGHQVIAQWELQEKVRGVITQNIDGLHQLAGSRNVLELHGTAREIECQDCGARYDAQPLIAEFLGDLHRAGLPRLRRRSAETRHGFVRPGSPSRGAGRGLRVMSERRSATGHWFVAGGDPGGRSAGDGQTPWQSTGDHQSRFDPAGRLGG